MNGFRGYAFGIGPIATDFTRVGKSQLDSSARWIHDFDVSNSVEAGVNFTASLKFSSPQTNNMKRNQLDNVTGNTLTTILYFS